MAHVGLHALGAFADRLGLGSLLSKQIPMRGERLPLHDRGKVLIQMALMLAGGGESCADIEHLRLQSDLFGSVPSDTTVFRTFHEIGSSTRNDLSASLAEVREKVWDQAGLLKGEDPVVLDIDASLFKPEDRGVVEDLVAAACNDARGKVEATVQEQMKSITGGLPLPPGFKL